MTVPLLQTKLYVPPPRPNLVSRPRLIQQLDKGLRVGCRLTLVSAQAGFGKTTLLSEWVHRMGVPAAGGGPDSCGDSGQPRVAWVSLDEGDNDAVRFWSYVVAALQTLWAEVGQSALVALRSPQAPPLDATLTTLINELTAVPDRFCLVLDDYHVVEAQAIHDTLGFLLEHQPPQMHLVIATRTDPALPIARLRGRGQMTEVRVSDLRFTPDEAAAFLRQAVGLDLPATDVAALEGRTEGWITGLQLAALSMQGREDLSDFVQAFTGSNRYVLDYLTEEVLQRLPERVQSFLLETAILQRLTGGLCDAVTGRQDGQSMLTALEQANLFLVPLDGERRWYRYHRLFADLLRARLEDAQPHRLPELHGRASAWYEEQGALDDAVTHAIAAGDLVRVGKMIERYGMPILMRGELTTVLRWVEALPEEIVLASASICVSHAWALLLTGQMPWLEPRLQQAERLLEAAPVDNLSGDIATIRAYVAAHQGDVARTIELAHQALDLLDEENLGERGIVSFILGGAHMLRGDVAAASRAMVEASVVGQQGGNLHIAVPALNALAGIQMLEGRLHQARSTAQEAIGLATGPSGRPLPFAGGAVSALAELAYEWDDLESALTHAQQSVDLAQQWGNSDTLCSSYLTLAQVRMGLGDLEAASDALKQAQRLSSGLMTTSMFVMQLRVAWARLWLAQGNLEAVARWVEEVDIDVANPVFANLTFAAEALFLARAQLAMRQPEAAMQVLEILVENARVQELNAVVIEALALQAMVYQAQGAGRRAGATLIEALTLAEPEGFVRRFVDLGRRMAPLLGEATRRGVAPEYVGKLLAALGEETQDGAEAVVRQRTERPPSPLVEPLSERELEVLGLIADGLSNREIAEELVVAVSTVKSHANHIFGKLAVKSRTQAVARAKELGLL